MSQEFAQPDQGIFALIPSHLINPGCECLAKGMGGEVGEVQSDGLVFLKIVCKVIIMLFGIIISILSAFFR